MEMDAKLPRTTARESLSKSHVVSPIIRQSCYTLAQALLGGGAHNPSGLFGDRFELGPVYQGSIFAALPFLGSDRVGTRGDSKLISGAVRVNACDVP